MRQRPRYTAQPHPRQSAFKLNAAVAAQVGCTRPAQSTELLHAGEVYASCFGTDSEGQDGDGLEQGARRYELLNASGVNALLFTTPGGSGLFTFGVRVVDPSFR